MAKKTFSKHSLDFEYLENTLKVWDNITRTQKLERITVLLDLIGTRRKEVSLNGNNKRTSKTN